MLAVAEKTVAKLSLAKRYADIRQQSMAICKPLQTEDYVVQPVGDVSPPKWHLGHTTWFFENFILIKELADYQPFNLKLNYFFNSYYESQGPRILRTNRGNMTRPSVREVFNYRQYVDAAIEQLLAQFSTDKEVPKALAHLLEVGLQHEQQHQELLVTDIKYILGTNPLYPAYQKQYNSTKVSTTRPLNWLPIQKGIYEIGYDGQDFYWDNEHSVHKVYLHDFEIADRLVTNGEYLEFMQASGYKQHEYWLSEGWEWAKQLPVKAPLYWYEKDGEWYQYTLNGLVKIKSNEPVTHVSYFEADAYAQWKGWRLPTEFEWEVACKKVNPTIPKNGNFLETNNFHPIAPQTGDDTQFLGSVWEWTGSAYLPYPNYPRFKGALGEYNGKFMVNQMVLRGGSCATPISHIRMTYRNFFQTDKRWQFTGIRLAR
ncbi:MAG: ergothioneine biosynthesis protein EgtB [Bacteroidota bacterium]